jgi:hypothetical protein
MTRASCAQPIPRIGKIKDKSDPTTAAILFQISDTITPFVTKANQLPDPIPRDYHSPTLAVGFRLNIFLSHA